MEGRKKEKSSDTRDENGERRAISGDDGAELKGSIEGWEQQT